MIQGVEQPDSGTVKIGKTAKLAFVDQSRASLAADKTVGKTSRAASTTSWSAVRDGQPRYLGRFNFKAMTSKARRQPLRRRAWAPAPGQDPGPGGNVLLDEPSNDLDVETLRALEEALLEFAGSAMVISHDRWFLDRICTHILACEGDSPVVLLRQATSTSTSRQEEAPG